MAHILIQYIAALALIMKIQWDSGFYWWNVDYAIDYLSEWVIASKARR